MIADAELLSYLRAPEEDIDTLRRLERAAIANLQKRTGKYLGVEAEITETIRWRGWPLVLSNEPVGGTITTIEQWSGSAWETSTFTYGVFGNFIFGSPTTWTALTAPSQFRVTYQAGYTQLEDPNAWDAPEDIQQAVIMLVGHWYENREAVVVGESATAELPMAVSALIDGHIKVAV